MKRSSKKHRGLMHPLTDLVLMIAVIGTFEYYYSRLEQDDTKLRTLFYEYWQKFSDVCRYVIGCDYLKRQQLNELECLQEKQHRLFEIIVMDRLSRIFLEDLNLTENELLDAGAAQGNFTDPGMRPPAKKERCEGFENQTWRYFEGCDMTELDISGERDDSSRYPISIIGDVTTKRTCPVVGSTEFDWKLGMDLQIKDVYKFEGRRKLLFRKLLQKTIITIICCCCCCFIITRLFLASKMYDVLLNVRKTKEIENKQGDFNNSKEKRVIQHDNGNFSNQTNGMKMNPDNEPSKSSFFQHHEQEVNESDVIRAKMHGILEREKPRLEHLVMCKICLDADASVVFLPCSHMVACRNCAKNLQRCPVCRAIIDEFLQVNQT